MYNDCEDISSGDRGVKSILFVTQEVVSVEVIDNLFVDDNLKKFDVGTKEADRPILLLWLKAI